MIVNPDTYEFIPGVIWPVETGRHDLVVWAAGFFDGEGSVGIHRFKDGGYYQLNIQAAQRKVEPLIVLRDLWGGAICEPKIAPGRGKTRNYYQWRAVSRKANTALVEMLPYLVVKKPQAEVAIEFQRRRLSSDGYRRQTQEDKQMDGWAQKRIKELNHL